MNSRRILILIGVILVLCILAVGFYFLFSQKSASTTTSGTTGTLPLTGNQTVGTTSGSESSSTANTLAKSFGVISNEPVLSYFITPANVVDIIQPDGEIDQITNGTMTVLNSLQIQNIISASFSYDGAKILVTFGDPSNSQTSIFDIASKAWTPMPAGWSSPTWSPSDYRIAYTTASANHIETFATVDVSHPKNQPVVLASLHAEDLSLAWPIKNQIIIQTKPSIVVNGSAWLLNAQNNTITPITLNALGLETLWGGITPGTSTPMALQFSVTNTDGENNPLLSIMDYSGNTIQKLKFLSLPSKCDFSITTSTSYLYCAVPRDQIDFSEAALPDNYNQLALFTADDIYRINLSTGMTDTLFSDSSQNFDVSNVSFENNTLFFVNRYDQKLYGIQLASSTTTTD
jgi:hypothetical protein